MKKKLLVLLTTAVMFGALVACGANDTAEVEPEVTEEVVEEVEEEVEEVDPNAPDEEPGEIPEGMARSYTTGEWVDEETANLRPVGFMIENTSMAQPSYGTDKADIYYEFEAEGGITRILALFTDYSGLDRLGNIRSCREYFAYTAIAWDAIYVHCGGSIEAYNNILDPGLIDNIDQRLNDHGYFFRSSDRNAPHNLYTSTDGINKAIDDAEYSRTHDESFEGYFRFNKDDNNEIMLEDGIPATHVEVYQSNPEPWFEYNEEDGLYYRYEFGTAQKDALAGQLAVKNIIIQITTVDSYLDFQLHDRVDVGIVGTGYGWYITNGRAIPIVWGCDGEGEVTHYYDYNENEIRLNQGKTWVDVMDIDYQDRNVIE